MTETLNTVLLVGLTEESRELAQSWVDDAAAAGRQVFGYAPAFGEHAPGISEVAGIPCFQAPGEWLATIDVVVPLLPVNAPKAWQRIMADCARLDREITRMRNPEAPDPEPECCWIETIEPDEARPELKAIYDDLLGVHGKLHNLYRTFSLQPAPLAPADAHYRAVLHDSGLVSEPWFLELLSSQAATLAGCGYALANHGENFINLLGDRGLGEKMLAALEARDYGVLFDAKQAAFLRFGELLCLRPHAVQEVHIETLRNTGATDTEILEGVQAIACFAYWTRFINGLGIRSGGESVGRLDLDKA